MIIATFRIMSGPLVILWEKSNFKKFVSNLIFGRAQVNWNTWGAVWPNLENLGHFRIPSVQRFFVIFLLYCFDNRQQRYHRHCASAGSAEAGINNSNRGAVKCHWHSVNHTSSSPFVFRIFETD